MCYSIINSRGILSAEKFKPKGIFYFGLMFRAFIRLKEQTISTEAAMTIGCITGSESLIQYAEKSGEEEENMKMCKALEKLVEEGKLEGESVSGRNV